MSYRKIGIFGGTFDPPTWGHHQVAKAALDSGQVDYVIFMPCYKHAFGKNPTDFDHRFKMCQIMLKDEPDIGPSQWEKFNKNEYSVDMLKHFIKNTRGVYDETTEFRFILGSDNYWKTDKWKDFEEIKKLAPPLWIHRSGYSKPPPEEDVIKLNSYYSSTNIRKCIQKMNPQMSIMTRSTVLDYIMMNGLYKVKDISMY